MIALAGIGDETIATAPSTVTFSALGGESVRSEIAVGLASAPSRHQAEPVIHDLRLSVTALGWSPVSHPDAGPSRHADGDVFRAGRVARQREVDQLSERTVRLLSDVLGAVHPVFLRISGDDDLVDRTPMADEISWVAEPGDPAVTDPTDCAHLRELVDRTIAQDLGGPPTRDADGDIVLELGTVRIFVQVTEEVPVVHVFSRLVHDITHTLEAPNVVAKLNAEYSFIKFQLAGGSVLACVHLAAVPFVPAQLRRLVATFAEVATCLDDELVRRLGGHRDVEPASGNQPILADQAPPPDELGPELTTLLRLDPAGAGVDATLTAEICGYDEELVAALLHIAAGQEAAWRAAAEESAPATDLAAARIWEANGWRATRRSLVAALEVITSLQV